MDVKDVIAAWKIGAVGVLGSTTPDHPATAVRGALDATDLGARHHEEGIITRNGVEMRRTNRNGEPPRRIHVVVSIVYSYTH